MKEWMLVILINTGHGYVPYLEVQYTTQEGCATARNLFIPELERSKKPGTIYLVECMPKR